MDKAAASATRLGLAFTENATKALAVIELNSTNEFIVAAMVRVFFSAGLSISRSSVILPLLPMESIAASHDMVAAALDRRRESSGE
jgi:hypothetical protein